MGQNQANPLHQANLASQYDLLERDSERCLTFLKRRATGKHFLVRELTFNELREFSVQLERLQKRSRLKHAHLTNLETLEERAEDQMCSNFYKIYALWEYPRKTLLDDIATRTCENRPLTLQEAWTLLADSADALGLLQENDIAHECLSSKTLLLEENALKVTDPLSCGLTTNMEYVLSGRTGKTLYLSPEQCESLANHRPIANKNAYKNDVFTLALVLLEAALLEKQDKCFQEDYTVFNYTVLARNINMFGERYGAELRRIIEAMTHRNIDARCDWIALQALIKDAKNRKTASTPGESQNTQKTAQFNASIVTKAPQPRIAMPPEPNFQKFFQGLPPQLSSIPSVSNEGGSSLRQEGQQYSNISSIPPYSFVSPVSNNASHLNHFDRSFQVRSTNNFEQSPSHFAPNASLLQSSTPPNIRFAHLSTAPRDMTVTFGSSLTKPHQVVLPSERLPFNFNQPSLPVRLEPERVQNLPSPRVQVRQPPTRSQPELTSEHQNQPVQVYEQFSKGSRYNGFKLNGMRHGQGTFYYQDGGRYEGEWTLNKMNGKGRLFYQSEKLAYEGEWLNDQFHGRGKLYNENPEPLAGGFDFRNFDDIDEYWEYYEGEFREDLKNGSGKLRFSSGEVFEGSFAEDMVQGEGVFYCRDGQTIHGVWMENHLVHLLN